jgi:hypothetical protein
MKLLFAYAFIWLALVAGQSSAAVPTGNLTCVPSTSAEGAMKAAKAGNRPVVLTVAAGAFGLSGGKLNVVGRVAEGNSADIGVTGNTGPTFNSAAVHTFTSVTGEYVGKGAFSTDANGALVAVLRLTDGQYFLFCAEKNATSLVFDNELPVTAELPKEQPLTDEQKLEKLFAEPPQQKGKEAEIFGRFVITRPDEGHYDCKASSYYSDGKTTTGSQIDSDDDHTGFDLFEDGSVRLQKTDGTFEERGDDWRHNPRNGVVLFAEGTLSVYFKWPIHVRKKPSESLPEVSLLYVTDYDSDGNMDDMTVCFFAGAAQSKSPNAIIAERVQNNLNPPPHGTPVKTAGLYYRQEWVTQLGFGNPPQMYQEDYYHYRYFQANGYVWLGDPPDDGDFEKLGCNKPMVNDKGEPTCTTYSVEDGLLSKPTVRIGHDAAVSFELGDGTANLNGTAYYFVPPQDDLKLDKFVRYFSYNGIASREGSITFKSDGRYESTSFAGVSLTTEIPDVARTTVVGSFPGEDLKGTYQIKGYTIAFKSDTGRQYKSFFGRLGDGFFMVGGQPYFEPSE